MDALWRFVGMLRGLLLRRPLGLCDIGDLDGMVCAALFKIRYPEGVVVFASPRDVNRSWLIKRVRWEFVGDLPCPGKARIRADHHETNEPCADIEFYDPKAPAAAVMALKALNLERDRRARDLVSYAVETDTANIVTEQAKVLNAATKGASYREKVRLAEILASKGAEAILDPFVVKCAERYYGVQRLTEDLAERIEVSPETLVVFEKNLGLSYRYLCILLERKGAEFTCVLVPRGLFGIRAYIGAKHGSKYDSAELAARLGGGGHQYAAGALVTAFPRNKALVLVLNVVADYLKRDSIDLYYVDGSLEVRRGVYSKSTGSLDIRRES